MLRSIEMKTILGVALLFMLAASVFAIDDLKIPQTQPTSPVYYGGCGCEDSWVLDRIYQNQLLEDARNRPSTLEEIEDTYYKLSNGGKE